MKTLHAWIPLFFALVLAGCTGLPEGVTPVGDFRLADYLGRWYEIARLDHAFERGLTRVSAEYSLRDDGTIRVVNRGYSPQAGAWKEAEGVARFARGADEGYLEVSFFGPFYSAYVVFEIDTGYQYAFVTSHDKSYLWLLARTPEVAPAVIERFLERSRTLGYETDKLVFVEHRPPGLPAGAGPDG